MGRGGVTGYVLNAHIQNASSAFFSLIFCFFIFFFESNMHKGSHNTTLMNFLNPKIGRVAISLTSSALCM